MTTIHKIEGFTLTAIVILFVIETIQNAGVTGVRFMSREAGAPRIMLISGVGLGGSVAGTLTVFLIQRRQGCNFGSVGSSKPSISS